MAQFIPAAAPMEGPRAQTPRPPDLQGAASLLKNIIFVVSAAVGFALWLASTITTPQRIDRLEEAVQVLTRKQDAVEAQANIIREDLKDIKILILKETLK